MKEQRNFSEIHAEEQQARGEQRGILESLEGFARLSSKQRQFVLNSLYIQQRANRGTDPASATRIQERPEFEEFAPQGMYITGPSPEFIDPELRETGARYYSSQAYVMNDYCFRAINELEAYGAGEVPDQNWHDAGPIASYEELKEFVDLVEKSEKPPLVVDIWANEPNNNDPFSRVHTTLLLGENSNGELMVWEKAGFNMPFQVTSLEQIYHAYSKCRGWRMRPLSI